MPQRTERTERSVLVWCHRQVTQHTNERAHILSHDLTIVGLLLSTNGCRELCKAGVQAREVERGRGEWHLVQRAMR